MTPNIKNFLSYNVDTIENFSYVATYNKFFLFPRRIVYEYRCSGRPVDRTVIALKKVWYRSLPFDVEKLMVMRRVHGKATELITNIDALIDYERP